PVAGFTYRPVDSMTVGVSGAKAANDLGRIEGIRYSIGGGEGAIRQLDRNQPVGAGPREARFPPLVERRQEITGHFGVRHALPAMNDDALPFDHVALDPDHGAFASARVPLVDMAVSKPLA